MKQSDERWINISSCCYDEAFLVQQIKSVYGRIFQFVMQASNLVHMLSKHG